MLNFAQFLMIQGILTNQKNKIVLTNHAGYKFENFSNLEAFDLKINCMR